MKHNTSWGGVADWYDEYLGNEDSYQKAVILPNLMRILEPKIGDKIVDIACGQGYFTEEILARGAEVIGLDIAPELIEKAESRLRTKGITKKVKLFVSSADDLSPVQTSTIEAAVCVLAVQNIKEMDTMFGECARILRKPKSQDKVSFAIKHGTDPNKSPSHKYGRLILVINHPAFRVPQSSDWYYESAKPQAPVRYNAPKAPASEDRQGRVVYQYLSEGTIKIDMNPGSTGNKKYTISYHRPLQVFMKTLAKHGFGITRIEEWSSHKKSQAGPRAAAEDKARKEIPMFMCIEASLLQ